MEFSFRMFSSNFKICDAKPNLFVWLNRRVCTKYFSSFSPFRPRNPESIQNGLNLPIFPSKRFRRFFRFHFCQFCRLTRHTFHGEKALILSIFVHIFERSSNDCWPMFLLRFLNKKMFEQTIGALEKLFFRTKSRWIAQL